MRKLFENGTVVLPDRLLEKGAVLVEDEKILAVYPLGAPKMLEDVERVDANGGYIMAGFIDTHVHGGGGYDFMDGTEEALRGAAKAHCLKGTTAIVPTTMACADEELEALLNMYDKIVKEGTGSADFLGLHLEGTYFAPAQKGAQPEKFLGCPNFETTEKILKMGKGHIIRWDAAPEIGGMQEFAAQLTQHGVMVSAGHTDATAEEAMAGFDWGFSHMTHFFCGMSFRRKRDQRVYCGAVEAAFLRDEVTVELIGDGRHVPKENVLMCLKIKGADKVILVTDAMRAAGQDVTESFLGTKEGGVPVIVEDHVAKLVDRSFYAGSVATTERMLQVAHLEYGVNLCDCSKMLSLTPARLCGVGTKKGSMEIGKDADIVVLNPEFEVQRVFVRGNEITA